jgi:L-asparaginase II
MVFGVAHHYGHIVFGQQLQQTLGKCNLRMVEYYKAQVFYRAGKGRLIVLRSCLKMGFGHGSMWKSG